MEVKKLIVSAVNAEGWEQKHECDTLEQAVDKINVLRKAKGVSNVVLGVASGRGIKVIGRISHNGEAVK